LLKDAAHAALLAVALAILPVGLSSCTFLPGPLALTVNQADQTPDSHPNDFKTLRVEIVNSAVGTVRGVTIKDNLPSGFTYKSTKLLGGEAIRTHTNDPAIDSPSPVWSSWSIPGAKPGESTKLTIDFVVKVGPTPGKTPNFVEVTTDDTDPLSARPIVLTSQPTPVIDLLVSARSPVKPNETTRYTISLSNKGTAAARGTVVSATLPSGFVYAGTAELGGNALRVATTDPVANSLIPAWGTWELPGVQEGGATGQLRIAFDVKVVGSEPAGNFTVSVTVTYNNLPAQTVDNQAQVTVIK
jgi:uncharacterized repeat protein (TIGR01451 family)